MTIIDLEKTIIVMPPKDDYRQQLKFKSCVFHFMLMPMGKALIHLFSHQE